MSSNQAADTTQPKAEEAPSGSWFSSLKPPGVKNIEEAYTRAGATNHHTPGYASKLGSQDQEGGGENHQGVGSDNFKDGFADQRSEVCVLLHLEIK